MEKQEIIDRLVKMYLLIQKDEIDLKDDAKALVALSNRKFGIKLAAGALSLYDEVCEKIEQESLTENKS